MSELKTLKDFEPKDTDCVSRKELKQEAMKWHNMSEGNKHKFIMDFFNITEEDLNDFFRGLDE